MTGCCRDSHHTDMMKAWTSAAILGYRKEAVIVTAHREIRNSQLGSSPYTEIFSKRRKIYSICVERLSVKCYWALASLYSPDTRTSLLTDMISLAVTCADWWWISMGSLQFVCNQVEDLTKLMALDAKASQPHHMCCPLLLWFELVVQMRVLERRKDHSDSVRFHTEVILISVRSPMDLCNIECAQVPSHALNQSQVPHHHGWERLQVSDRKLVNHTTEMILWSIILPDLYHISHTYHV
jgi:hypothetical protein